jgi:hypothetical protein
MIRSTLKRLLIDTVEDSISKLRGQEKIEQQRIIKIQQYIKKKNEYIDSRLTSMIASSRENLEKWYDKFTDYSSMGFLSCKQYWKCLCDLGYKFAQHQYTDVHSFMFYRFCSKQPKMTLDQYMISILVLRNEIPTMLNRDDILQDIFGQLNTQLRFSYKAIINEREFLITPEIFYEIICEINRPTEFSKDFYNEYLSIVLQLFYW